MVPGNELAQGEVDTPRPHLFLVQSEEVILIRCECCDGLFSVSVRRRDSVKKCTECRRGRVVTRDLFHAYWLELFTREECEEMGKALFG